MAINLNALNQVYARKEQSAQERTDKIKEGLNSYLESETVKEKAIIGQDGKNVDSLIEGLNIYSSDEDIQDIKNQNEAWLEKSLNIAKDEKEEIFYKSVYENKNNLITNVEEDKNNYDTYSKTVDEKYSEIETVLDTNNGKFDFENISDLLDEYKKAGANILAFNKDWVHKSEYDNNVKNIASWIQQGKKLEVLDIDSETPGVQVKDAEERPVYQSLMDEAFDLWTAGDVGSSDYAIRNAISSIDAIARAEKQSEAERIERQFELDESRVATYEYPEAKVIKNFLDANEGKPLNEVDLSPLNIKDRTIVAQYLSENGNYRMLFDEQFKALEEQDYLLDEQSVLSVVNNIQKTLGEGISSQLGAVSKNQDIDDLVKSLKGPGTFTVGKNILRGQGTRAEIQSIAGENVKAIFNHLEDDMARFFTDQFAGAQDADIRKFVDGKIDKNSPDYLTVLDKILDMYYPKDMTGTRNVNDIVKEQTQKQFAGSNIEEQKQFDLLIDNLKLYALLRDMDKDFKQDRANPAGLPD